jgi:predicted nucleic acid-binding protein
MLYFDTDVWIHTLINQDEQKAKQSTEVLKRYTQSGYVISNLNIQEILLTHLKITIL